MRFPDVSGENLNREPRSLPDDFGVGRTLALIAYTQRQQFDINTWLDATLPWEAELDSFRVVELPVIRRLPRLARRYIDGGMRAGIPDLDARGRTITLYTDVGVFNRTLGLDTSRVPALLVENGEVTWKASGRATPELTAELGALLQ